MYKRDKDFEAVIVRKLTRQFDGIKFGTNDSDDIFTVEVNSDSIREVIVLLKDDAELGFNFLTTLCGMHYPETNQLGVVYHLHNFIKTQRIRIKTAVPLSNPEIDSITSVWPAANWQERETYDFYGIIFKGHPNLIRILNVDEMTDFPLRKDFPLEDQTREDKDDTMFGR